MPNPSSAVIPKVTYDVVLISTKTGIVRAILAEKLESNHSLDTVKAWDAQVGTKQAVVTDAVHGKHKVGDRFKDHVKGFGYFTAHGVQNSPPVTAYDPVNNKIPFKKEGP